MSSARRTTARSGSRPRESTPQGGAAQQPAAARVAGRAARPLAGDRAARQTDDRDGARLFPAAARMAGRRGVARGERGGGSSLTPGNVPIPGFRHALDTGLPCGQVSSPSIRFRKELPAKSGPRGSSDPLSHAALNTAFVTPAAEFRAPHPDREVVMAADCFSGESLVGDGNEVAHIDLIIGSKAGHAGQAFVNTLSNNTDGFTKLLAVVTPNLPAKPDTLLFNKVTLKNATQAVQMFGPAQAAVARAVVDSVSSGVIPRDKVDDYCILVGVFIHWQAKNDKKIFDFNYRAVKESIERALKGQPKIDQVISQAKTASHPFAGGADKG